MIGYSLGSILAIELIKRLETTNIKNRLVLIDGAPEYIKVLTKHYTSSYMNDEELQITIMINIMKIYETEINEEVHIYITLFFIFFILRKLIHF